MGVLPPQEVTITYQHERLRWGWAICRSCQQGPGHGPYWYGNSRGENGKLRSASIGKELPEGVTLSEQQTYQQEHQLTPAEPEAETACPERLDLRSTCRLDV